jgi:hypothetical protein
MHFVEPMLWQIPDVAMERARRDGFLVPPPESRLWRRPPGTIILVVTHATPYWVPVEGVALTLDPTFSFWPFELADTGLEFVVDLGGPGYGEWNGGLRTPEVLGRQRARLHERLSDLLATPQLRSEHARVLSGERVLADVSAAAHHIYQARHSAIGSKQIGLGSTPSLLRRFGFPSGFDPVDHAVPPLMATTETAGESGTLAAASRHLPSIGEVLDGRFKVTRELGRGGIGAVYEVHQLSTGHHRALKVLLPHHARSPELAGRFRQEAMVASILGPDGIAEVYDAGDLGDGRLYVLMELLHGLSLRGLLEKEQRLSVPSAAFVAAGVCLVLARAHSHQIVHRDVKPENVFLSKSSGAVTVKVLDFGLSKFNVSPMSLETSARARLGTPAYMSPEQHRSSKEVDGRSDIFACGIMLYELIAGVRPFDNIHDLIVGRHVPLHERVGAVPASVAGLVERALKTDPADRLASADELRNGLLPFADSSELHVL